MTAFQILLVILGLIIIGISYIISEKLAGSDKQQRDNEASQRLSNETIDEMKSQIVEIIRDDLDTDIARTEDKLNEISNEKIIAVSEYSDQILEKINQNHTEVVFLYNMLNEKEEVIKKLLNRKTPPKEVEQKAATRQRQVSTPPKNQMQMETPKESLDEVEREMPTDEILSMHKQGKTVMEIAKQLEIGQGEIQLVIGLAKGVKS